jgi:hypothetical protein
MASNGRACELAIAALPGRHEATPSAALLLEPACAPGERAHDSLHVDRERVTVRVRDPQRLPALVALDRRGRGRVGHRVDSQEAEEMRLAT